MNCCDRHLRLGLTESVCPVCLATIPAERVAEGGTVYLKKTCPDHGTVSTPVWRGLEFVSALGGNPARFFSASRLRNGGAAGRSGGIVVRGNDLFDLRLVPALHQVLKGLRRLQHRLRNLRVGDRGRHSLPCDGGGDPDRNNRRTSRRAADGRRSRRCARTGSAP